MSLEEKRLEIGQILKGIFFLYLIFLLPCLDFTLFAPAHLLTPLALFVYLTRFGLKIGNKFILTALVLAGFTSLPLKAFSSILFTLTLFPLGYILAHCGSGTLSPVQSGLRGFFTQIASWGAYGFGVSVIRGQSLYQEIIEAFGLGIDNAIEHYRNTENLPIETQLAIEQTFVQLQTLFPLVLPSLMAGITLLFVCITMVAGNNLLLKIAGRQPWQPFRFWQLPDRLVWAVIGAAAIAFFGDGLLQNIGVNVLIFFAVLYCCQGFSLFVFFLEKWKIPAFFRALLYVTVVFQSFGTALLITMGLSSVWINYREFGNRKRNDDDEDNE